jgi:hypothetical protein
MRIPMKMCRAIRGAVGFEYLCMTVAEETR